MSFNQTNISRRHVLAGLVAGAAAATPGGLLLAETRIASATKQELEKGHALAPALKLARSADSAISKLEDYTATFQKEAVVGKSRVRHKMQMKVRHKPFSVYLKFISPDAGREVIYVSGKNDGKLLTHGIGLEAIVGTLELDPKGSLAMRDSRYPVTMIGMQKAVRKVIAQWEAELSVSDVAVKYFPNAKIGSTECRVMQTSHAKRRSGLKFHMTRLYVAKESGLPVRTEQFAFPSRTGAKPLMLEQYTYADIRKNVGLKSIDFDTKNSKYDY